MKYTSLFLALFVIIFDAALPAQAASGQTCYTVQYSQLTCVTSSYWTNAPSPYTPTPMPLQFNPGFSSYPSYQIPGQMPWLSNVGNYNNPYLSQSPYSIGGFDFLPPMRDPIVSSFGLNWPSYPTFNTGYNSNFMPPYQQPSFIPGYSVTNCHCETTYYPSYYPGLNTLGLNTGLNSFGSPMGTHLGLPGWGNMGVGSYPYIR